MPVTKRLEFLGDSLAQLRDFPEAARKETGVQLHKVQLGLEPSDWKPMTTVGPGVRESASATPPARSGVLYVASIGDAVYVLHAFQKKTQQTVKRNLDLAASRFRQI
ncbi:type II toxin-antitoxin system RelE/ParE family toxin [Mesorhizobium sp. B2-3-14]|uniref:type II toxin-antitoxin system RelE/ParE family toxin n=1 Tax=Mesorhizobium sp. B2-3-14 TaxID=2589950 RepID=UPI0032B19DDA